MPRVCVANRRGRDAGERGRFRPVARESLPARRRHFHVSCEFFSSRRHSSPSYSRLRPHRTAGNDQTERRRLTAQDLRLAVGRRRDDRTRRGESYTSEHSPSVASICCCVEGHGPSEEASKLGGFQVPIFLYENVHLVPGQTVEYLRAFAERWLPLSDEYDSDLYTLSGFFQPDVLYNTQPTVNILWTIHSWEVWDGRHARGSVRSISGRRTSSTRLLSVGAVVGPTRSSNRSRFRRSRRRARQRFAPARRSSTTSSLCGRSMRSIRHHLPR